MWRPHTDLCISFRRGRASKRIIRSGYEPRSLIYKLTGTTERRSPEFVEFNRILRKDSIFSLDSTAMRRRVASPSGIFKREHCFHAITSVTRTSKQSSFPRWYTKFVATHAERAKSLRYCFCTITRKASFNIFHFVFAKRHTTPSARSHVTLVSTIISRCSHKERHNTVFALSHTKLVSGLFSRYHAKSITRHKPLFEEP